MAWSSVLTDEGGGCFSARSVFLFLFLLFFYCFVVFLLGGGGVVSACVRVSYMKREAKHCRAQGQNKRAASFFERGWGGGHFEARHNDFFIHAEESTGERETENLLLVDVHYTLLVSSITWYVLISDVNTIFFVYICTLLGRLGLSPPS